MSDPSSFKAGYTVPNAILSVQELFELNDEETTSVRESLSNPS